MVGRRKVASRLPPRLYEYKGKRKTTYYTVTPSNKWLGLGPDLVTAKKRLLALEDEVVIPGTVGELIDDFLNDELRPQVAQGKRAPRTLADREEQAVNLKGAFGLMRIGDLTANHVWQYLHKFRGKLAPVRANREISFLQKVFSWARDQGLVQINPCSKVKRNEETPRSRFVSDAELRDFCAMASRSEAGKRAALAAMIAYLCGKAQAQVLRLSRKQITDAGIEFYVPRKKGASVLVTWSDELRLAVSESIEMPAKITPLYVVHNRDGGPYTSDGFKSGWQDLMATWVAQGGARFTFHDLRAKAVTDVIESGRKASELTGHRLESTVTKIYDRRAIRKAAPVR